MKLKEGAGDLSLGFHPELLGRTMPAMMVILNDPHRKWVLNGNPEGESGERRKRRKIFWDAPAWNSEAPKANLRLLQLVLRWKVL